MSSRMRPAAPRELARALLRMHDIEGRSGNMSVFETQFCPSDDAERIRSAFYGFLSRHAAAADGDARLRTEMNGSACSLKVRLWSAEAMDAFLRDLYSDASPDNRRSYE